MDCHLGLGRVEFGRVRNVRPFVEIPGAPGKVIGTEIQSVLVYRGVRIVSSWLPWTIFAARACAEAKKIVRKKRERREKEIVGLLGLEWIKVAESHKKRVCKTCARGAVFKVFSL